MLLNFSVQMGTGVSNMARSAEKNCRAGMGSEYLGFEPHRAMSLGFDRVVDFLSLGSTGTAFSSFLLGSINKESRWAQSVLEKSQRAFLGIRPGLFTALGFFTMGPKLGSGRRVRARALSCSMRLLEGFHVVL